MARVALRGHGLAVNGATSRPAALASDSPRALPTSGVGCVFSRGRSHVCASGRDGTNYAPRPSDGPLASGPSRRSHRMLSRHCEAVTPACPLLPWLSVNRWISGDVDGVRSIRATSDRDQCTRPRPTPILRSRVIPECLGDELQKIGGSVEDGMSIGCLRRLSVSHVVRDRNLQARRVQQCR
jgi:hypothetical protein